MLAHRVRVVGAICAAVAASLSVALVALHNRAKTVARMEIELSIRQFDASVREELDALDLELYKAQAFGREVHDPSPAVRDMPTDLERRPERELAELREAQRQAQDLLRQLRTVHDHVVVEQKLAYDAWMNEHGDPAEMFQLARE